MDFIPPRPGFIGKCLVALAMVASVQCVHFGFGEENSASDSELEMKIARDVLSPTIGIIQKRLNLIVRQGNLS